MGAPRVTEAAIQRAINAAKGAGIPIGAVIVNNLDGTVRIEANTPGKREAAQKPAASAPKQWGEG